MRHLIIVIILIIIFAGQNLQRSIWRVSNRHGNVLQSTAGQEIWSIFVQILWHKCTILSTSGETGCWFSRNRRERGGSALLSGDIDRYGRRLVTLDSPHPPPRIRSGAVYYTPQPRHPVLPFITCAVQMIFILLWHLVGDNQAIINIPVASVMNDGCPHYQHRHHHCPGCSCDDGWIDHDEYHTLHYQH